MGGWRRYVLGATVVALTLVAAGCGGGGVDAAATSTTTVAPSTTSEPAPTTTVLTDEQAVLAAYQGYWAAVLSAGDPPDPNHPDLARHATGQALTKVREAIEQQRAVGQIVRLPTGTQTKHDARIEALAVDRATVYDCAVDDGLLIDWASGRVLNDAVVTWRYAANVVLVNEVWLVESVEVMAKRDGATSCAD